MVTVVQIKYGIKNRRGFSHISKIKGDMIVLARNIYDPEEWTEEYGEEFDVYSPF